MTTITIITPVYNGAETIAHSIRCVASQTKKCQHIIVDGDSSDRTSEIIENEALNGQVVIREHDQGMYDAINKGLKQATGEVIGILNADDFYPNDGMLNDVAAAFSDPAVDTCYGDLLYVDRKENDKVVRKWISGDYDRKKFYSGWMPPHPTFFTRKRLYDKYGGYRLDMGSAADYELMLRLLLKNKAEAAYIPQVLVHMRNEGMSNASLKNRLRANKFDREAWRVNGIRPRPWTLFAKPLRKIGQWL